MAELKRLREVEAEKREDEADVGRFGAREHGHQGCPLAQTAGSPEAAGRDDAGRAAWPLGRAGVPDRRPCAGGLLHAAAGPRRAGCRRADDAGSRATTLGLL